jgi:archaetidylinositol phosphate synthase
MRIDSEFRGDKKEPIVSPFAPLERAFIQANVHRVPSWLRSHHLTYMTIAWSGLVLMGAFLASYDNNLHWLWICCLAIFLQWLTDCFDGAVGQARNEGLRRWGFYMDHFLDYVFMACASGHLALVAPDSQSRILFLLLIPLYGGFEVNSWLEFGATGRFRITYAGVGPTEVRILFLLLDVLFIAGLREPFCTYVLPVVMIALVLLLAVLVHGTSKRVWAMDMAEKEASQGERSRGAPGEPSRVSR